MRTISPDEIRHFLLDTPRTGKLASIREDGRPHITPISFTPDGDDVVFTTWHTTVKAHNIERDGHVSLCVEDDRPPYTYVIIEGCGNLIGPSYDEQLKWSTKLA